MASQPREFQMFAAVVQATEGAVRCTTLGGHMVLLDGIKLGKLGKSLIAMSETKLRS